MRPRFGGVIWMEIWGGIWGWFGSPIWVPDLGPRFGSPIWGVIFAKFEMDTSKTTKTDTVTANSKSISRSVPCHVDSLRHFRNVDENDKMITYGQLANQAASMSRNCIECSDTWLYYLDPFNWSDTIWTSTRLIISIILLLCAVTFCLTLVKCCLVLRKCCCSSD
jgi:hypothetical protein